MFRIILVLIILLPSYLLAQEKEDTDEITIAQANKEKPEKNKGKRKSNRSDDYKSSEEISEDLSVSYPVDI
ncbi:hypothetical protein [Microbulbifer sp. THAF38]|uniref:hypothetical protein n=1 Tax=unclassified Microbulbifer TaxID=2619833 RepID=UPI0012691D16|nr:hypothetical protein [Microbulbifer sp. THAF38]QFT53603.1 hypothetical protein FIU95_03320 [Microbulbifer sp. THAF38]